MVDDSQEIYAAQSDLGLTLAQTDLEPGGGNTCVVHTVQRVSQVLAHDDGSIDGEFQVVQRRPEQRKLIQVFRFSLSADDIPDVGDDTLHSVDFLL